MKSFMRALCVGAMALGVVGGSGLYASASPVSPAAGTAYDIRTLYLTDNPNSSNTACTSREIYIAANTYSWQLYFDGPYGGRSIYLEAGNYQWRDCIDGQDNGGYIQTSTLTNPGGGIADIVSDEFGLLSSGDYTFGSQLSS